MILSLTCQGQQLNHCTKPDRSDGKPLMDGDTLSPDTYFFYMETTELVHVTITKYGVKIFDKTIKVMTQKSLIMSSGQYVMTVRDRTISFVVAPPTTVDIYDMWIEDGQFVIFTDEGKFISPIVIKQ